MNGCIPKTHKWCTHCITDGKPCPHHQGPDGTYIEYDGREAYEPSEWVLSVVGGRFTTWDFSTRQTEVYFCIGYDPRNGFWMEREDGGRKANISEAAINRSYHRVWMTAGAWMLLEQAEELGRFPTGTESKGVNHEMASNTLRRNALLTGDNQLTYLAYAVLDLYPKGERMHRLDLL